jgi:hypothetical protein
MASAASFIEAYMRTRCRKCRSKLPAPTDIDAKAFCTKHCQQSFYWRRCAVCEEAIEPPTRGTSLRACFRRKCRSTLKRYKTAYLLARAGEKVQYPTNGN